MIRVYPTFQLRTADDEECVGTHTYVRDFSNQVLVRSLMMSSVHCYVRECFILFVPAFMRINELSTFPTPMDVPQSTLKNHRETSEQA